MKKLFWLYGIPNIYLINWLQYFSYGEVAAAFSWLLYSLSFVLAFIACWKKDRAFWLKGSALQLCSNLLFVFITNLFDIQGGCGGTWNTATGIFSAQNFVLAMSAIAFALQTFFVLPLTPGEREEK